MPINKYNKTKLSDQYINSGGGLTADNGPYIGVVMDNHDPTRTGRIRVWIKVHGDTTKDDSSSWRTVSYLSPFYGVTPHEMPDDNAESDIYNNGQSYGMWMTSPDIGIEVLCMFANGDPNQGFYIGYVPAPQMNHMIPAMGARVKDEVAIPNTPTEDAAYAKAEKLPISELMLSTENMNDKNYYNAEKPVHTVIASQMWKQGTLTDPIRGPISSSVQRESPSYTYGISTPGRPLYKKPLHELNMKAEIMSGAVQPVDTDVVDGRRGGHSFVMDDGDIDGKDRLMRFRSSSGHQITLSDDGSAIYIQHANGFSWIELGNEGTLDVYTENSINLRTKGEINFHADENINIHSGKDIKMYAKENIKIECEDKMDLIGKKYWKAHSQRKILFNSGGVISMDSIGVNTTKASGNIIETAPLILMNTVQAPSVPKPPYIKHNKFDETEIIGPTGWNNLPGQLDTITSRAPTHEPYKYHNHGVNVKSSPGGSEGDTPAPGKTNDFIKNATAQPPVTKPVSVAEVADQASKNL